MRKFLLTTASLAFLVFFGCTMEEDFVTEPISNLINVTIPVGTEDDASETKVTVGNKQLFWSQNDAIGIFAGDDNVNRKFTLASESGKTSGSFSGQMAPVETSTTLYVYYPYTSGSTQEQILCQNYMSDQVFEGTFEEDGVFSSYGKYAFLYGKISDFTIDDSGWKSGNVQFEHLTSLLKFKISSELDNSINILSVGLDTRDDSVYPYPFIYPGYFCIHEGYFGYGYYTVRCISTSVLAKPTIAKNETKYVQMVAMPTTLSKDNSLYACVEAVSGEGRNVRYLVEKTLTSNIVLEAGKVVTVNVPLQSSTPVEMASRVKITTTNSATSLTIPTFSPGSDYVKAINYWSDKKIEEYEAGAKRTFDSPGQYTVSCNHWGESTSLTFDNLTGISAIDFTNVY